jgi:hypothetical protein
MRENDGGVSLSKVIASTYVNVTMKPPVQLYMLRKM